MLSILVAIGLTIAFLLLLSTTAFNIVMLIPGHFILSLVDRAGKLGRRAKAGDADGSLSIVVGIVFWTVLVGTGYGAYRWYVGAFA